MISFHQIIYSLVSIYPIELEINATTAKAKSSEYLELRIEIDNAC
jgi:hypothetical protein